MSWDEMSESVCQIARALSVAGDRWTLLIMREVGMGMRRFEEIQAQTGMSSNLLAIRLKKMEEEGMLERKLYSASPPRYEYHATPKGKELDAVLLAFRAWGMRWGGFAPDTEPAVAIVHKESGATIEAPWQMPPSDHPFTFDDIDASVSKAFQKEREARSASFKNGKQRLKKSKNSP
jgi:DNA-binding HxlR family transcriptional regulator